MPNLVNKWTLSLAAAATVATIPQAAGASIGVHPYLPETPPEEPIAQVGQDRYLIDYLIGGDQPFNGIPMENYVGQQGYQLFQSENPSPETFTRGNFETSSVLTPGALEALGNRIIAAAEDRGATDDLFKSVHSLLFDVPFDPDDHMGYSAREVGLAIVNLATETCNTTSTIDWTIGQDDLVRAYEAHKDHDPMLRVQINQLRLDTVGDHNRSLANFVGKWPFTDDENVEQTPLQAAAENEAFARLAKKYAEACPS